MVAHCKKKLNKCFNCGERPEVIMGDDVDYPYGVRHTSSTCPYRHEIWDETSEGAVKIWNKTNKWSYWIKNAVKEWFR